VSPSLADVSSRAEPVRLKATGCSDYKAAGETNRERRNEMKVSLSRSQNQKAHWSIVHKSKSMTTREWANGAMPDLRFAVLGVKGHTQV
jgi:hypothetical protein